jgi:hypothetical protein
MSPVAEIEIHFDHAQKGRRWAISSIDGERPFTFDLPKQLLKLLC